MSILSAIKEARHESNNLEDLAKLPQTLIMSMVQNGQIEKDMLMPILGKKAEMADNIAKMNAAKALAAQGGAQPTVMDQYMGKIAQAENPAPPMPEQQMQQPMPQQMPQQQMAQQPMPQGPEDVGIATQATQPMSMAGGGIVAFDDGGDVDIDPDDNYQEMIDQAEEDSMNEEIYGLINQMNESVGRGERAAVGIRSGENKNIKEDTRGRAMEDKGDIKSRLLSTIMQKESGGRRYDKSGNLLTSSKGAEGEMQVMPYTAMDPGFGVKPAQNRSPDELKRVGDDYAMAMYSRYGDPKLAMIAYNMGPGATDKWLAAGADPRKLPKETQGYIRNVNLASGGEVKHFVRGDLVMDDFGYPRGADPRSTPLYDDFNRTAAELENEIERNKKAGRPLSKEAQRYLESKTPRANVAQPKPPAGIGALRGTSIPTLAVTGAGALYQGLSGPDQVDIPTEADVNPGDLTPEEIAAAKRPALIYPKIRGKERYTADLPTTRDQKSKPIKTSPAATAKDNKTKVTPPGIPDELKDAYIAPPQSKSPTADATPREMAEEETFNLMQYIRDQQADRKEAAKMDKWQAGLAAGLGMLGGTSQYAFENIGKGGQMGVQQLANSQKLRASQNIASDKMLGTAYNAEILGKLRRDQLAQNKDLRTDKLAQDLQKNKADWIARELKDRHGMDTSMIGPLKLKQRLNEITPKELQRLNLYEETMRDLERKADKKFAGPGTGGYKLVGVR